MAMLSDTQLAFLLILLAGVASPLGAVTASYIPTQTSHLISISLAFSCGVLIWVSLIGLHPESLEAFQHAHENHSNHEKRDNWLPRFFTMMSIMLGLFVGWVLDVIVHHLDSHHSGHGKRAHKSDVCCKHYATEGEECPHSSDADTRRSSNVAPAASNVGTPPPIPAGALEGIPMHSIDPADFESGAEENPIAIEPATSVETPPGETEHQLSAHTIAMHNLQKMINIRKRSESHSVVALRGSTTKKRHMSADDSKYNSITRKSQTGMISESDAFFTDSEKDSDEKRGDGGWYNFSRFRVFSDSRRASTATSATGQNSHSHVGRIKSFGLSGRLSGISFNRRGTQLSSASDETTSTALSWADTKKSSQSKTEATQTTALLRDSRRVDISDLMADQNGQPISQNQIKNSEEESPSADKQQMEEEPIDSGQMDEDELTLEDKESFDSTLVNYKDDHSHRELVRAALVTTIAICIHNFPEGLATYTSTVADADLGFMVAFAVALHNLPLGISVGMPVYVSYGSDNRARCWAVMIASVAGLSSLFGGFVGWLAFSDGMGARVQGISFGMVIGIMLWTAWKELLPQCRRADPTDQYTTWLIFFGFLVMDASLIVFDKSGGHDHGVGGGNEDEHNHDH